MWCGQNRALQTEGRLPERIAKTEIKGSSDGLISTLEMAEAISIETSRTYKSKEKKDWKESPEETAEQL